MRLEFWFDFSCPYAYLGSTQIEALADRAGAELVWRPMLLGGVFRAVEMSQFPASQMPPAKARHNGLDMLRWADWWNVPLAIPAGHPQRTVRALRALLAVPEPLWPPLIHELYRSYWVRGDDFPSRDALAASLVNADIDRDIAARALGANDDPEIVQALRDRTDAAIARGVFGAPTMFVGEGDGAQMFWGQDRLHMVERALGGWRPE
jgi:2-hydroxychromene-2-carboxylate isomerase